MSINYFINQFDLPEPPSVCEHGITEGDFGYTDCKKCQPDECDNLSCEEEAVNLVYNLEHSGYHGNYCQRCADQFVNVFPNYDIVPLDESPEETA